MNREIKFRIWSSRYNSFMFDDMIRDFINDSNVDVGEDKLQIGCSDECSLEQFTGIKDKNGIEIYEGDILLEKLSYVESQGGQLDNIISTITFTDGAFMLGEELLYDYTYSSDLGVLKGHEVIGNIHKNKDLIKS